MDYSIEKRNEYLFVRITGEFSDKQVIPVIGDIKTAILEKDYAKVFIDSRNLLGPLSVISRFNTGVLVSQELPVHVKFAIVGKDEDILPDKHMENVAVNRGSQLLVTSSIEEAIEYLAINETPEDFT